MDKRYVRRVAVRWQVFRKDCPDIAATLGDLVLGVCGDMAADVDTAHTAAKMAASDGFARLRIIAMEYADELGIREETDTELALWIRTICFLRVMHQEHTL